MLITVADFCVRVNSEIGPLVAELKEQTGRGGASESFAWESSLPRLAEALSAPSLQPLHLFFDRKGQLELEYRLPASGSWCDAVLLGQGPRGPAAVIVELKHWTTADDRPGPTEPLIYHMGSLVSHPSVQVGSYVEYCQRFHSSAEIRVHGQRLCSVYSVSQP
ncbi:MAG: hypothetical protein IPI64_11910 [Chloracidobacterium sp.]|nr:hypothetical protein [Chloracidobacterium sp.]